MKVLIYSMNYSPELTGIGKYNGELSEWLSRRHSVRVLTTQPYYPEWKVHRGHKNVYSKSIVEGVVVYRVPIYVPNSISTLKRILHLLSFTFTSLPIVFSQIFWKPDIIFYVQPTLFSALNALILSKLSRSKIIMHIQDYEVDALFGLGMVNKKLLKSIANYLERSLMKSFDKISTISYSMMLIAKNKGISEDKVIFFPNWSNVDYINPNVNGMFLRSEWGFTNKDFIVLYAGNIGKKQGLDVIIRAAKKMKTNRSLKFVIVGDGVEKDKLISKVEFEGLTNIIFKPLQPWSRMPEMLTLADVHLVIQKKGVADVVMPSKLTNILSAGGNALVTAEKDTELGVISIKHPGIYTRIDPENDDLFISALRKLFNEQLDKTNTVARQYALDYLSRDMVLSRYEREMENLSSN